MNLVRRWFLSWVRIVQFVVPKMVFTVSKVVKLNASCQSHVPDTKREDYRVVRLLMWDNDMLHTFERHSPGGHRRVTLTSWTAMWRTRLVDSHVVDTCAWNSLCRTGICLTFARTTDLSLHIHLALPLEISQTSTFSSIPTKTASKRSLKCMRVWMQFVRRKLGACMMIWWK